jgi:hypothetical protein
MARPRHPNKHIEAALKYAEDLGWRVKKSKGHAHCWGMMYCPRNARDGCKVGINSTPKNPQNHARQLRSEIDLCDHS